MSDGRGGTLPEDQYVGEWTPPPVPETPADSYDPADVAIIDDAYKEK